MVDPQLVHPSMPTRLDKVNYMTKKKRGGGGGGGCREHREQVTKQHILYEETQSDENES